MGAHAKQLASKFQADFEGSTCRIIKVNFSVWDNGEPLRTEEKNRLSHVSETALIH